MMIISASIDLDKIDKAKITVGKNGHRYYGITITVFDEPNNYGKDVSITENQTADQRAAKAEKKYLGDGKTIFKK